MILRFFLLLLYHCFKALVLLYQVLYFPFTTFRNRKTLDFKGPGIIISNHPNTMVDPLNVISRTPRQSFFLANASMFKNPVIGYILRHLYCIPIMRPGKDQGVKKVNNGKSFAASFDHLSRGGVIFIAPEGGSELERHLRPFKTGTARIALGAEAARDFSMNLHIYPVGLTYEQPTHCGSRLYMEAGQPIRVADWREAYEKDEIQAVKDLTEHLENKNRQLLIHTDDQEQDQLLYRLERILQHDQPLPVDEHYDRTQRLLGQLKILAAEQPSVYQELKVTAANYREQLKKIKQTDRGISRKGKTLWTLPILLGWPVWLYGRINNFLPYELPRLLERKIKLYIGYRSTVKILAGTFSFPIFYWLQYQLAQWLIGDQYAGWYLLSLPISGILTWVYARHFLPRWEGFRYRNWAKKHPEEATHLEAIREQLGGIGGV